VLLEAVDLAEAAGAGHRVIRGLAQCDELGEEHEDRVALLGQFSDIIGVRVASMPSLSISTA
jgi:hypothetical protein